MYGLWSRPLVLLSRQSEELTSGHLTTQLGVTAGTHTRPDTHYTGFNQNKQPTHISYSLKTDKCCWDSLPGIASVFATKSVCKRAVEASPLVSCGVHGQFSCCIIDGQSKGRDRVRRQMSLYGHMTGRLSFIIQVIIHAIIDG